MQRESAARSFQRIEDLPAQTERVQRSLPAAPLAFAPDELEAEPPAQLKHTRIPCARNLAEVSVGSSIGCKPLEAAAHAVELRMVEGIERLDPQLEVRPFRDREVLVHRCIEVQTPWPKHRVFARVTEALVQPARPGWRRRAEHGRIEPLCLLLHVFRAARDVRTVAIPASQSDRVLANSQTGALIGYNRAGFEGCRTRQHPTTERRVREALRVVEDRQVVDIVRAENMTPVQCARTLVILQVVRIAHPAQIVARNIDLVRPGVIQFSAQAPTVLNT